MIAVTLNWREEKKMNILFININNEMTVSRGAGYVVAGLRKNGNTVKYVDTLLNRTIPTSQTYDRIMISSMSMLYDTYTKPLIGQLKQQMPNTPITIGGIHATIMGDRLLADGVDEVVIIDLAEAASLQNGQHVKEQRS